MGYTKQDAICARGEERIVRHGRVTSLHCGCVSRCVVLCVAWRGVARRGVKYPRSAVTVLTI